MGGAALEETGRDHLDQSHHFAKVRVVGSNPVIRSNAAAPNMALRTSGSSDSDGVQVQRPGTPVPNEHRSLADFRQGDTAPPALAFCQSVSNLPKFAGLYMSSSRDHSPPPA